MRGDVCRQPDIAHVCSKHRERRNQPRLRGRKRRPVRDEPRERRPCGVEVARGALERSTRHRARGDGQHERERQADERAHAHHDPCFHAAVPRYRDSRAGDVVGHAPLGEA